VTKVAEADARNMPDTVENFQTLAVNQQPGCGTNYPFVQPSSDIRYLLGDLWLGYEAPQVEFQLPLKVAWLYGFGATSNSNPAPYSPVNAYDIVITDAAGKVVFNSTTSTQFTSDSWGLHLRTLSWTNACGVLRLTFHLYPPNYATSPATWYTYMVPANGTLDSRTYERLPRRVRSLTVNGTRFTNKIVFGQGYNLALTPTPPKPTQTGGRLASLLGFNASPGSGTGAPPCDDSDGQYLLKINGSGPDAGGNFSIDATACYRLQRPVAITSTSPRQAATQYTTSQAAAAANLIADGYSVSAARKAASEAALTLDNDCSPCCECSDYVNVYKSLYAVDAVYRKMGRTANKVVTQHQANINRWNAELACRTAATARVLLNAEPSCVLFTAGAWCNMFNGCASGIQLRATVLTYNNGVKTNQSASAMVLCRESYKSGTDTNLQEKTYSALVNWPVVDTFFNAANPSTVTRFRTRLQLECETNNADTATVWFSVHIGTLLFPPGVPNQFLPLPSVPSVLETAWASHPPTYPLRFLTSATIPISNTAGCGTGCA